MKLDHAGITVPDLDEAVEFFRTGFGAEALFALGPVRGADRLGVDAESWFELVMLDIGGGKLELLHWQGGNPPRQDCSGGTHIGIEVASVAEVLERVREIPGVHVHGEPVEFTEGATPGLTNAFIATPWGSLIELLGWRSDEESEVVT